MSFKWETQYNSPNYTPASRAQATWGRPRTIEAIAIHWWGDPNTGPTYEGVIATLVNPSRGASAHIVATGTGRRVACLVNLSDASWATNSANPYTISIECDPRCRDEDYDVVAEVIAQIRSIYGNLPLVPHKQFVATACPGNYSLDRLNKLAATKSVSKNDAWGKVTNKVTTPPKEEEEMVTSRGLDVIYLCRLASRPTQADYNKYVGKLSFDDADRAVVATSEFKNTISLIHNHKFDITKFLTNTAREATKPVYGNEPDLIAAYKSSVSNLETENKDLKKRLSEASGGSFTDNDRNTLNGIQKAVQSLWNGFKAIFNIKE